MIFIGIRKLKNRLSAHPRMVRRGGEILVTDRGEAVAELRQPLSHSEAAAYPELVRRARSGKVRLGAPNRAVLYPRMPRSLPRGAASQLLDEERGER